MPLTYSGMNVTYLHHCSLNESVNMEKVKEQE